MAGDEVAYKLNINVKLDDTKYSLRDVNNDLLGAEIICFAFVWILGLLVVLV
jgi:hypothetical protein